MPQHIFGLKVACTADHTTQIKPRSCTQMAEPIKPPVPPFTLETATKKVKAAEDAWNTCDPAKVALAYTPGSLHRVQTPFSPVY